MKRVENQDYYQILEVSYKASWGEIQKAYELLKTTYSKGAMASYSLFDFTERGRILDKIEEAYHVLSHPEKRVKYDRALETIVPELVSALARKDAPSPSPPSPILSPAPAPNPLAAPLPAPIPIVGTKTEVTTHGVESEIVTGKTLKTLREKQGVSLQEIADKTRINISYLEFIEANSYGSLPAPVYIIGYLKQYAKIIALDNAIMEGYMKGYQQWRDSPKQRERFG
jgi:curved DNA-binding protein CbpA